MNSTQVHCSPWKSQQMQAKKKKKRKMSKIKRRHTDAETKRVLNLKKEYNDLAPEGCTIIRTNPLAINLMEKPKK